MTMKQRQSARKKEVKRHKERIVWLESKEPKWVCGTPVFVHDIKTLLDQSYRIVAGETHV